MNAKRLSIGIPVVIGLALALLLLIAIGAAAGSPPAQPPLPGGPAPVIAARTAATPTFWTSGWVSITQGETRVFTHSLGGDPDDYAVDLQFMDTAADGRGINAYDYGGNEQGGLFAGANWQNLDSTGIQVYRQAGDFSANMIRVSVWVADPPDWCSEWTSIGPGTTHDFNHPVGGNVDDYTVGLWFKDLDDGYGINQRAYGGIEYGDGTYQGAYWRELTTSTVTVVRYPDDIFADRVRVCIYRADPPDWDSGWQDFPVGETMLTHNLRWNPSLYIVRMEFKDLGILGAMGIHHFAAGGMIVDVDGGEDDDKFIGANWEQLTNTSVLVVRWSDDIRADQVRVRIWLLTQKIYLPLMLRNF